MSDLHWKVLDLVAGTLVILALPFVMAFDLVNELTRFARGQHD